MGRPREEGAAGLAAIAGVRAGGQNDVRGVSRVDGLHAFVARGRVLANRWIDKVKQHVADVRVVDLPGAGHYVFLTREADVLREIRTFVARLRQ
jgi:pimeloyl-ACP methyl ester carboxylesterase